MCSVSTLRLAAAWALAAAALSATPRSTSAAELVFPMTYEVRWGVSYRTLYQGTPEAIKLAIDERVKAFTANYGIERTVRSASGTYYISPYPSGGSRVLTGGNKEVLFVSDDVGVDNEFFYGKLTEFTLAKFTVNDRTELQTLKNWYDQLLANHKDIEGDFAYVTRMGTVQQMLTGNGWGAVKTVQLNYKWSKKR